MTGGVGWGYQQKWRYGHVWGVKIYLLIMSFVDSPYYIYNYLLVILPSVWDCIVSAGKFCSLRNLKMSDRSVIHPPPYESYMEKYCLYVKGVIESMSQPPATITYPKEARIGYIAPIFKLWDPVSQYNQNPPYCLICNVPVKPRSLGIKCVEGCTLLSCVRCTRLKG